MNRAGLILAAVILHAIRLEAQSGLPPQPFEAARAQGALTATLVSNDPTQLVVQADNGQVVTFLVDATSSVPPGLVRGSRVSVRYDVADGDRYRVASVGIPKIPLEPGTTTDPPPTVPASPEASPTAAAAVPPRAGSAAEAPPDAATPKAPGHAGAAAASQTPPASAAEGASPHADLSAAAPTPGPRRQAAEEAHGHDALVIGGGLALVTAALGLLLLTRR